ALLSPPDVVKSAEPSLPEGTRFYVLFPASAGAVAGENGDPVAAAATNNAGSGSDRAPKKRRKKSSAGSINVKAHLMSLMGRGFTRLYEAAKNEIIELQTPDSYEGKDFEGVYVLVDRLVVRADSRSRLVDSLETCFREGHGQAVIQIIGDTPQLL